ncbi:MAG: AAA family ATPase, partial [bacterium]
MEDKIKVILNKLQCHSHISSIDRHFALLMAENSKHCTPQTAAAFALVSQARSRGDIALDIAIPPRTLYEADGEGDDKAAKIIIKLPEADKLGPMLFKTGLAGKPGDQLPVILENNKLYLYRFWAYEKNLADMINQRVGESPQDIDITAVRARLLKLFGKGGNSENAMNMAAAVSAITRRFTVISGGPGTGKTYTVARILDLFLNVRKMQADKIALCAPTGKAAARLKDSIKNALEQDEILKQNQGGMPMEAFTIHRLLKTIPNSNKFRHNAENPLPYELVVVDEAS